MAVKYAATMLGHVICPTITRGGLHCNVTLLCVRFCARTAGSIYAACAGNSMWACEQDSLTELMTSSQSRPLRCNTDTDSMWKVLISLFGFTLHPCLIKCPEKELLTIDQSFFFCYFRLMLQDEYVFSGLLLRVFVSRRDRCHVKKNMLTVVPRVE